MLAQLGRAYTHGGAKTLAHVGELATAEEIPANYLVQILNELRNAGLINSKRGKQGGYALARAPDKIQLREIVVAVDGELLEPNFESAGHSGVRVAGIWSEIGANFEAEIAKYSLADFVVSEAQSEMYYI